MQTSAIGGCQLTDVKEFTVIPTGSPEGAVAVVIVMPVVKRASAWRNSSLATAVFRVSLDKGLTLILSWVLLCASGWGREIAARRVVLIKLDIVNEVVNRTGITKTKAEMAVETVFESMKRALSRGERIELRGFGIFNVRPRKTGIGRNPRTGAEVAIPPGKAVRFKPGKELQALE
jgi:DNA-binding protein HU-beta